MVIDQTQVRQLISKYGKYDHVSGRKNICKVKCQVCGAEIMSDLPLDEELDTAFSKRGDLTVWHRSCGADKVWQSKIK